MKIKVVSQDQLSGEANDIYTFGKSRNKRFIIVEHGDKQLQWHIPPRIWNVENNTNEDVFDQINMYFAQLDMFTQNEIFTEYENIHNVLRSTTNQQDDCENLIEAIRPMAARLFSHIDPIAFHQWVWTKLRPNIPSTISSSFNPETMPGTRQRTYLLEDYKGLIPLAIVVRAASPFWFDFATLTRTEISREHKDTLAYSLIEQSWPALSPAMERLHEFVDHTVGNDRNNPAAILAGIGTDDFVHWAVASLVISRLPVVDVMGINDQTPVASALYNHIRHRVSTVTTSQPPIRFKFAETNSTDENNQSYLEGFRNRMAQTVGQEAIGDYYLERTVEMVRSNEFDPMSLLERIAPGIDNRVVVEALNSSRVLNNQILTKEQVTIAAWLFHPYSQVSAVGNLRKARVVELLGLAQAVLLHLGQVDLAMLVTGSYRLKGEEGGVTYFGETIAQLRANERESYREVFPLEQRSRNLKKVKNMVLDDVYEIVRSMQEYDITCTFNARALTRIQGKDTNREYFIKRDTVSVFMEFIKYIAERPLLKIDPMAIYQQKVSTQVVRQKLTGEQLVKKFVYSKH